MMAMSQVVIERAGRRIRISILNEEKFVESFKAIFNEAGFVTWGRGALRLPDNVNIIDVRNRFPLFFDNNGYGISLYDWYKALTARKGSWEAMSWVLAYDFARDARNAFPDVVALLESIMYQITSFVREVIETDRKDLQTLEFTLPAEDETQVKDS